ncbi:MAG: hypothetical protein ACRDNS_11470 [Trebonia sp.]
MSQSPPSDISGAAHTPDSSATVGDGLKIGGRISGSYSIARAVL